MSTLGYNTGLIEDYYKQYLDNPESVSPAWREFFAGYSPDASVTPPAQAPGSQGPLCPGSIQILILIPPCFTFNIRHSAAP